MGRMVFGMMLSLDGYVAGPPGGAQLPVPGEELHRHFNGQLAAADLLLYGRRLYEVMRAWDTVEAGPETAPAEAEFATIWRAKPKIVVSRTLGEVSPGVKLIRDDVDAALRRLKAETDGTIDAGGPLLAYTLSRLGLIDEYRLYFLPVVLGGGFPFFPGGMPIELRPVGSESLPQGVVLLRYAPRG